MTFRRLGPVRRPLAPSARRRVDIDAVVGFACMLMLPLALWLA